MRPAFLLVLASTVLAQRTVAQFAAGASATLANRYLWRGVTRVAGPVLQPSAWLGARAQATELSASLWGDLELRGAGATELTDRGTGRSGLGELDLELALARELGWLALSGGWIRYTFHGDTTAGGRGTGRNTSELYLRAQWRHPAVTPGLATFCDLERVRGCYLEAELALPVVVTPESRPALVIALYPSAGWSLGQGVNADASEQAANFAGSGLTHVDLPLGVHLQFSGPVLEPAIALQAHAQWNRDGATRTTDAAGGSTRIKLWLEASVSVAAGLPRERRR